MADHSVLSFSLDSSLGRLARWLRLLGHDSVCQQDWILRQALSHARSEGRVLLTRSHELDRLGMSPPRGGFLRIEPDHPRAQLSVVGRHWPIFAEARLFTRCSLCNSVLETVDVASVRALIPPFVARTRDRFRRCFDCLKVYWGATHAEAMVRFLTGIAAEIGQPLPDWDRYGNAGSGSPDPAPRK